MTNNDNALSTKKYSAEMLTQGDYRINLPFLIPIYQRLYTWEHQHVERLLVDLWAAYRSDQPEYFIGAVVVSPANANPTNKYQALELIDGQQRMTTLWLIASVLVTYKALTADADSLQQWKKFMALGDDSSPMARLDFLGRENDKAAVSSFIKNWCCSCDGKSCDSDCNGWLKNEAMSVARSTISRFLTSEQYEKTDISESQNIADKIPGFSAYIWSKATFVITRLHSGTDKNRFFDTMNSRGIQLEKHEILKAKLLNGMDEPSRQRYAKAWDLCADINGYMPTECQEKFDYGRIVLDEYCINKSIEISRANKAQDDFTLEDILSKPESDPQPQPQHEEKKQTKAYRSVVSFPVFLLHVLRIFVCHQKPPAALKDISVDDKKLISQFEENLAFEDKPLCKKFIGCLLECRLLLDNFVIKGHVDEGSEFARWEIWSHLAGKKADTRDKRTGQTWDSITMLQTMMYFSQDTTRAPWLTDLLKGLREETETKGRWATAADGGWLLAQLQQQDKQYAEKRLSGNTLEKIVGAEGKGLSTKVPHYWFFKLEYCLWELWFNKNQTICACAKPQPLIEKKPSFRMRHVTSIEHVSPQSRNNGDITDLLLDRFGNLVLISVGANSSYSDKDPSVKAAEFTLKLDKGMVESLKLAHIFKNGSGNSLRWNDDDLKAHETEMLAVLKAFHPELEKNNTCDQEDNKG
ncbi:DUF262 domain-containing protein [Methylovulum psychrotolerans]|uniref:DUF262 domain-containing protein n=1 Tax=Methylovulum psychrotolerans TaxID=1704499 RepID=A0A2S5CGM1_9GAMM|nr:DUF262 domain-containing protein [Methylovulum psychrotolerans]POZ49960.1 hypothetical protein AADEFJLK_04240 [Methylovulum psychrotolerans]